MSWQKSTSRWGGRDKQPFHVCDVKWQWLGDVMCAIWKHWGLVIRDLYFEGNCSTWERVMSYQSQMTNPQCFQIACTMSLRYCHFMLHALKLKTHIYTTSLKAGMVLTSLDLIDFHFKFLPLKYFWINIESR